MIYIIQGLPGNGKTTFATYLACESLRHGVSVFTNYPVKYSYKNKKVGVFTRKAFDEIENYTNADIFIDEAQLWYPSRSSSLKYNEDYNLPGLTLAEHRAFAASRHYGINFYFVAQNVNRIDKIIRELFDTIYVCRKIKIPFLHRFIPGAFIGFKVFGYLDLYDINRGKPYENQVLVRWPFGIGRLNKTFKSFDSWYCGVDNNNNDNIQYKYWSDLDKEELDNIVLNNILRVS